ncbi:MAG: heme o synthase [Candidatus Bathyarchaeia archaeon]
MRLISYLELTKPKTVALLVWTSIATTLVATHRYQVALSSYIWVASIIAITLATAGCNSVTSYLDRDVDARMERTTRRPLPSMRIHPAQRGLYFGMSLLGLSFVLGWLLGLLPFTCLALGAFDNIVIYSLLLKRRNPVNIVLGGLSGGFPALFGWFVVTDKGLLEAVMIAGLVVAWIPTHIWSLAIFFSDDYRRAKIPMLPIIDFRKAIRCILGSVVSMFLLSMVLWYTGGFGWVYLVVAFPIGMVVLGGSLAFFFHPTKGNAWKMFKLSSPYLALVFFAMVLDSLIL